VRRTAGLLAALAGCAAMNAESTGPYAVVLGIAQDAGVPQAGCSRPCCAGAARRLVSCLAVVDPASGSRWIFDATPDLPEQLRRLDSVSPGPLSGIFLTHAHIGHYTGLMHLGREAMGARKTPVHAMPRMREFLRRNGPWDQLVRLENIEIRDLEHAAPVRLNDRLSVTPFLVPHRDEYSETVGFHIRGPIRSILFIPDIDKWEKWDRRIEETIAGCDVAYLDGTFFENGEIPGRDMSEIPHPFITESMSRFAPLSPSEKAKIRFIHLNHTNPALDPRGEPRRRIERAGFRVAEEMERVPLAEN
jgi:pyrroloquinoline quinone biosynthesis protein B